VSGYIIDDLVLIAGLVGTGSEHQRRELSRLLHGAIDGGPGLDLPALCLTAAAAVRPGVADHVSQIVAVAPPGVILVSGLTRIDYLDALVALRPGLGWSATHAAVRALATGRAVLTIDPDRYAGIGLDVLTL
jgi:hypothetical protein